MGRHACKLGAGLCRSKDQPGNGFRGPDGQRAESPKQKGPGRETHGPQNLRREPRPLADKWFHDAAVHSSIAPQFSSRRRQRALQNRGRSAVERVRQRQRRLNPFEPVLFQGKRGKDWRSHRQRMHRRADIVRKTWKRELSRSRAAPDRGIGFEKCSVHARVGQTYGSGEPVGSGTDYISRARGFSQLIFSLSRRSAIPRPSTLHGVADR